MKQLLVRRNQTENVSESGPPVFTLGLFLCLLDNLRWGKALEDLCKGARKERIFCLPRFGMYPPRLDSARVKLLTYRP